MSRTARSLTRATMIGVVAGFVVAAAACGGSTPAPSTVVTSPAAQRKAPAPSPTAVPVTTTIHVRDLISTPDQAGFDVAFSWKKGTPNTKAVGFFDWRQGSGWRRFDYSAAGASSPPSGWFSLEQGLDASAATQPSAALRNCLWFGAKAGSVNLTCGGDSPALWLSNAIFQALGADAVGSFAGREIAGRPAVCYAYTQAGIEPGVICIDEAHKLPLYLAGRRQGDPFQQEIEATAVVAADPVLIVPPDLPGNVAVGDAPTRAITSLQFPALMHWDQ